MRKPLVQRCFLAFLNSRLLLNFSNFQAVAEIARTAILKFELQHLVELKKSIVKLAMVMPNFQKEPVPPPPIPVNAGKPEQPPQPPREPPEAPEQTPELPTPQPEPTGPRTNIKCQNSSMVHSFEYNDKDQTLRVYFRGGQIYDYFFVPENIADEFKRVCEDPAESAGKWFARTIRKTFEYQKVA